MATRERIDLHEIDRAIAGVQRKLKAAGRGADGAARRQVSALVRKLEAVRKKSSTICPRTWFVWPLEAGRRAGRARRRPAG